MNYWLFKTEPTECSIDDLAREPQKAVVWEGVRNYQARNFLREAKVADQIFIYHSSCKHIGIAGIAEVATSAYTDPSQFQPNNVYFDAKSTIEKPRWSAIDVRFVKKFPALITLDALKHNTSLTELALVQKASRLSVIPVSTAQWLSILQMAG